MSCSWQVEIDDYATRVLAKHWPDVPRHRDVREVGAHNLAYTDLICGGFPCQDISNAGRRVGLAGARSGLWSEFARIVREIRPRFVLVENVAALLYRGLGTVLGDLAALGYDCEWHCLQAYDFGAPHIRDRIFILAIRTGSDRRSTSMADAQGTRGWRLAAGGTDEDAAYHTKRSGEVLADTTRRMLEGDWKPGTTGWTKPTDCGWWAVEPDIRRMAHGISHRVDRLRGLGNAVVPQVAEYIGRQIINIDRGDT